MLIMKSRKKRHVWLFSTLVVILLAVICTIFILSNQTKAPEVVKETTKQILPANISSTVLFTGNVFWGRYINDWSMASPLKYQYPFSRLNEFNRDNYNAWISGLECPLVAGVHLTSAEEDSTLSFNCSPDYLPEAAKWFTAFTLANNHTDNQGSDGFLETRTQLEKSGIQYFGHYDPDLLDDICEIISLPVSVINDDKTTTEGNLPVAECAYHGVFKLPSQESIDQISKYSPYLPVVAMPHMGAEYKPAADQLKVNTYRAMIDAGADVVLGDHPHVVQNSESYDGHLIVYSMGNFIFDQQEALDVTRSAAIKMAIKVNDTDSELLKKWLAIGEDCKAFKDNCLTQIKEQKLAKLNIEYVFSVVGSRDSGKVVKPATELEQSGILQHLNWANTIRNLKAPYSGL